MSNPFFELQQSDPDKADELLRKVLGDDFAPEMADVLFRDMKIERGEIEKEQLLHIYGEK